jgi:hypothetical protein
MSVIEVSKGIDRPPADVFRFVATDHVQNHPRWDPQMQLEQETPGPIGVGTVIRRRHTHGGSPVEGTMEITEYEPDRLMGAVINDGPMEMRSWMEVRPDGDGSILALRVDLPGMEQPMDPAPIEGSLARIKELIESGDEAG